MVTNERQRLYALEARKNKTQSTQDKKGKTKQRLNAPSPSPSPDIDPKLNNYHYNVDETFPPENTQQSSTTQTPNSVGDDEVSKEPGIDVPKKYLVNIMQGTRRIKPEITLEPCSCSSLSSLIQHVHTIVDDETLEVGKIKVWGPRGMIDVRSENIWKDAIATIMEIEWINGEVKCVVEVEELRR
jgi:hypothetical protein